MTVGFEQTSAKEDGVALNEYNQVLKSPKAHDRSIVGVRVFQNARNRQLTLASFGHDSLKLWSIAAFEDDFSLFPLRTINPWNCGIQSFTTNSDGKKISVVSTDCSLHHIYLGDADDEQLSTPRLEIVNNGLMEIWFCLSIPSMPDHFLTVNFQSIQLQILNQSGGVVKGVPFEKAKQISSIAYGSKFIAIGSSQGVIFVVNSNTLGTLYSHEGHSMKVRCLEMLDGSDEGGVDDQKSQRVLSGSDDKTIKLFALTDSKAQLERIFCGHKGIITGLAICQASGAQRFASSGADNYLILWEMESGQKLHIFAKCATTINDLPRSICFAPNGRYLLVGTEESTILAFRVPQPPNYVEEQLEETGEGEEGLVVGEEEEEVENDENRMEMDEPGEEWANQYGRQYSAEYENENDNYNADEYRPTQSNFDQPGSVSAAEHDEGETEENEEEEKEEEWRPNENDHPIGGEGEDRERQELDEELGID